MNILVPIPVQLIPLIEYAIEFVPAPNVTHLVPFHVTPIPCVENILVPIPVQVIPSYEYAIEFVPVLLHCAFLGSSCCQWSLLSPERMIQTAP